VLYNVGVLFSFINKLNDIVSPSWYRFAFPFQTSQNLTSFNSIGTWQSGHANFLFFPVVCPKIMTKSYNSYATSRGKAST